MDEETPKRLMIMATLKGWKKTNTNPPIWTNKTKKNKYVSIGQALDGKYDVWVQKNTTVTKWLAGGHAKKTVSKTAAFKKEAPRASAKVNTAITVSPAPVTSNTSKAVVGIW